MTPTVIDEVVLFDDMELGLPSSHALIDRLELDELKLQRARDADTIFALRQQLARMTEKYQEAMGHLQSAVSKP